VTSPRAKQTADARLAEKKFRMENDRRIANAISGNGDASVGLARAHAPPWTGSWLPLLAAWLFGALVLAGLIVFVMHFGAIEVFVATVRRANPIWIAAAVLCQIATYFCAATVWFIILKSAGSHVAIRSLLRLALVELFANQAVPTGGLSGSFMVMRGLHAAQRRRCDLSDGAADRHNVLLRSSRPWDIRGKLHRPVASHGRGP
jgi:hypothetical protein